MYKRQLLVLSGIYLLKMPFPDSQAAKKEEAPTAQAETAVRPQANKMDMVIFTLSVSYTHLYSLDADEAATAIENAINRALEEGVRTGDLARGTAAVSTDEMGDIIARYVCLLYTSRCV